MNEAGSVSAAPVIEREDLRSGDVAIAWLRSLDPPGNDFRIGTGCGVIRVLVIRAHLCDPRRRSCVTIRIHALTKSDYFGRITLIVMKVERIEDARALGLHRSECPSTTVRCDWGIYMRCPPR